LKKYIESTPIKGVTSTN